MYDLSLIKRLNSFENFLSLNQLYLLNVFLNPEVSKVFFQNIAFVNGIEFFIIFFDLKMIYLRLRIKTEIALRLKTFRFSIKFEVEKIGLKFSLYLKIIKYKEISQSAVL